MARYTIELKDVVKNGHNIFDFAYPFYDERKRPDFERRFIRHFYFREIGQDTVERFKVHLEDKMQTVFPYYNELFKTATVEYSILDNYDIRETTTLKRENVGASSGESFSVGKILNEQSTETNEDRQTNKVGEGNVTTVKSNTELGTSETTRNDTATVNESVDGTRSRTGTESESGDSENIKKFLDTPQGQVDLSDSKYLTTLGHDTEQHGNQKDLSESETSETDTEKTVTTVETKSKTDNVSSEGNETVTNNDTVDETATAKTTNTFSGSEHTTADNNTRTRSEGSTTETIEHTRKGNIGVDTDADMIQKHIALQKILTQIEKMFFDECEDLFMLVW